MVIHFQASLIFEVNNRCLAKELRSNLPSQEIFFTDERSSLFSAANSDDQKRFMIVAPEERKGQKERRLKLQLMTKSATFGRTRCFQPLQYWRDGLTIFRELKYANHYLLVTSITYLAVNISYKRIKHTRICTIKLLQT